MNTSTKSRVGDFKQSLSIDKSCTQNSIYSDRSAFSRSIKGQLKSRRHEKEMESRQIDMDAFLANNQKDSISNALDFPGFGSFQFRVLLDCNVIRTLAPDLRCEP